MKRPGSICCYIQWFDIDVLDFLELRKSSGDERVRCRDLFTGISYNDIFFIRERDDKEITLFSPYDVKELLELHGKEFTKAYEKHEKRFKEHPELYNKNTKSIKARDLLRKVIISYTETGMPFAMFKDNANRQHKLKDFNLSTIGSSNLCLTGDTVIAVADERNGVKIKDLAEYSEGEKKFSVYSGKINEIKDISEYPYTIETKEAIAFSTGINKVIKVTLSNGDSFKCTPNHNLMLWDGSKLPASECLNLAVVPFFTYNDNTRMINELPKEELVYKNEFYDPSVKQEITELTQKEKITINILQNYYMLKFDDKIVNNTVNATTIGKKPIYVISIDDLGEEETFNLTVDDNHNYYIITSSEDENYLNSQGLLVANCTEILQPIDSNYTGVCNLASVNFSRYTNNKRLKEVLYITNRALDNAIDLTKYPSKKAERFQKDFRSIGIGMLGIAEYLANNKIHYGSKEHEKLCNNTWKFMKNTLEESSKHLAHEKGKIKIDYHGCRNAYLMAIAPNSGTAILAGTTNGVEPAFNLVWADETKLGTTITTAPNLNRNNIDYYKNPYEVPMKAQLKINSIRQKYIDMGISQNIYIDPENISMKEIRDMIIYAWEVGLKTLYYCRSMPPKKAEIPNSLKIKCVGCEN